MLQLIKNRCRQPKRFPERLEQRLAVHRLQRRVAIAFTPGSSAPDPAKVAFDAVAAAIRAEHRTRWPLLMAGLVDGTADVERVSEDLTQEAERCIRQGLDAALAYIAALHGPPPGVCAIVGLGKLGGREMTAGSDLDMIFVYAPDEGVCPQQAGDYFDRAGKAFVNIMTWSDNFDLLYQVDIRLRPYGGDGPLATPLSSLTRYYGSECWTWELQAMTRARVLAGDPGLGLLVQAVLRESLVVGGRRPRLCDEVAAMRALMEEERPIDSPWEVKCVSGGMIDIEFIAQTLQLAAAASNPDFQCSANTIEALKRVHKEGNLGNADAAALLAAMDLYARVQHVQRLVGVKDPSSASRSSRALLLKRTGAAGLSALSQKLVTTQAAVRRRFDRLVAPVSDSTAIVYPFQGAA